jgi:hypothetical protein
MNQDQDKYNYDKESNLARSVKKKPQRERIALIQNDKKERVKDLKEHEHTKNKSSSKSNTHDHGEKQKVHHIEKDLLNKQSRSITTTSTTTTTVPTTSDNKIDEGTSSPSIQLFISSLSDSPILSIKAGFILSLFVTNGCVHNVTNPIKGLSSYDNKVVDDVIHIQNFFTKNSFNLVPFSGETAYEKMFLFEAKARVKSLFEIIHSSPDFIIYFAGHGKEENGDWVFWNDKHFKTVSALTDIKKFQDDNDDWYESLALQDIIELWNNSSHYETAQLTIISDSCYSGMWCNLLDTTKKGRICVIAASQAKTYGGAFARSKGGEFPFKYTVDYEFREPLCSFFRLDDKTVQ